MPATVEIREKNGALETPTIKTNSTIRFKNADNALVDTNDKLTKPSVGGSTYSYEKWIRLYIADEGPDGSITLPRAYSEGVDPLVGITLKIGVAESYQTPQNTASSIAKDNFFSYTVLSPLDLTQYNEGPFIGTDVDIADYIVMQVMVNKNASTGVIPGVSFNIAYDET